MPPVQFAPLAHCVLHAPQLSGLVVRSTHALLQLVSATPASFVPQTSAHMPFEQTGVLAGQTFPHAPQLFGSLCVCMQIPLQRRPPL
jgi:hypothetical protein